jgi:hypothetical protein
MAEVALCRPLLTGAALEAWRVAPVDVLPVVSPGTSGAVAVGAPHPARAMMAAPARIALADPCLLMKLPRSRGVTLAAQKPGSRH